MKEDIAEEQEKEIPHAWTPGRRGSVDRDLPDGSDIFQLAMADFIQEEDNEIEVTITTVRLKDCSDTEDEDRKTDNYDDDDQSNKRRIRWSKEVNVFS